jgi:RAQPRD family integrative conjugative element protein
MFKKSALLLILLSNVLLNVHWVFANDAQTVTERQRLESVINELAYLQTYLQETKSSQKLNVRSRFDYERINGDLDLLKHGISEYLSDIPNKPKGGVNAFREIQGNYTR